MGSKLKIACKILPIILSGISKDQYFVDLFCGGCNLIDKVDHPLLIANDFNDYLICFWKAMQKGWKPPTEITKEQYYYYKANQEKYPKQLICFVALLCSFGGKWWGGYASNSKNENYAERGSRVCLKQIEYLKHVKFLSLSYDKVPIPDNSIIYCDPPYKGTVEYKDKFNHDYFWAYCREKAKTNKIFISEYTAPEDFISILSIPHKTILDKNSQKERIEKLYIHESRFIEYCSDIL